MKTYPDTVILTQCITDMLPKEDAPIKIVSRHEFIYSSTFPVEIVTCKTVRGEQLSLFCKYLGGKRPNNYGHHGGVEYEAKIYEGILDKTSCSTIRYYGQCNIPGSSETLMVLEYIGATYRMNKTIEPEPLPVAAKWIGIFHHLNEGNAPAFVTVYDRSYYSGWSSRFRNLTSRHYEKYPWIERISNFFDDNMDSMLSGDLTIIHGEYYPHNVLMKNGIIYPIDWESAAIAPGEIDLASLTEKWESDIANRAIEAYKKNRWPNGIMPVNEFEKRFLLSKLYFIFRWWSEFGMNSDFTKSEPYQRLLLLSQRAGVHDLTSTAF